MKRNILLTLIAAAAVVMGCSQQDDLLGSGGTSKKSITLSLDELSSRADVTDMSRYILEVYEGSNADATAISHTEQGTSSFTIELTEGSDYTFLAWADYGTADNNTTGDYDAASLKAIKVITGKTPSKEAFGGKLTVTVDATASYDMIIKHSVAQVNFIQKEALTAAANTLKVDFPKTYQLNLASGAATEILNSTASVPAAYTFSGIGKVAAGANIGTSYIVASTDAVNKTLLDLKTTFNAEVTKDITSVPFTMNYRTNITGAYSNLYDSKVSSICEDDWNTPENDEEFPVLPKVGYFVYSDGTISKVYRPAPAAPVSGLLGTRAATDTCIGVVYWVDPMNDRKAKIISSGYFGADHGFMPNTDIPGAYSTTDGLANTLAISLAPDYSAENYRGVAWALAKRQEKAKLNWYVPAIDEMLLIDVNIDAVDAAYAKLPETIDKEGKPAGLYKLSSQWVHSSTTISATQVREHTFSSLGTQDYTVKDSNKSGYYWVILIADIAVK